MMVEVAPLGQAETKESYRNPTKSRALPLGRSGLPSQPPGRYGREGQSRSGFEPAAIEKLQCHLIADGALEPERILN
jgi:hypothetical protein